MATDSATAPSPDLSAPKLEPDELNRRRASLDAALKHRPDVHTLLERNILHSTASPAIQAKQDELKFHRRADSLEQALKHRPRPEDLIRDGIISPRVESGIVDGLNTALKKRPSRERLIAEGIIVPTESPELEESPVADQRGSDAFVAR